MGWVYRYIVKVGSVTLVHVGRSCTAPGVYRLVGILDGRGTVEVRIRYYGWIPVGILDTSWSWFAYSIATYLQRYLIFVGVSWGQQGLLEYVTGSNWL